MHLEFKIPFTYNTPLLLLGGGVTFQSILLPKIEKISFTSKHIVKMSRNRLKPSNYA